MSNIDNEIRDAFQAKHLKQILVRAEYKARMRRRRRVFMMSFCPLAVAACLVLGILARIDGDYMSAYSGSYLHEVSQIRGGSEVDDLIADAVGCIQSEEYDIAESKLEDALSIMKFSEDQDAAGLADEDAYIYAIEKIQRDDINWYKAHVFMHQGRIFKAKRILRQIADSQSIYADDAKGILDDLKIKW
ncbi:MAG: hypothetical protein NC115_05320 [Bacteroidales bacterium]|nr:hypothetical protein [Bacteroidales bacterium]